MMETKTATTYDKFIGIIGFIFRKRLITAIVSIIAFIIFLISLCYVGYDFSIYTKEQDIQFELILSYVSLLFIVVIWTAELKEEWRDSCESFLSVDFYDIKEECVSELSSDLIPLLVKADLRNIAQKLGGLKYETGQLPLNLKKQSVVTSIKKNPKVNSGKLFLHYQVSLHLDNSFKLVDLKNDNN